MSSIRSLSLRFSRSSERRFLFFSRSRPHAQTLKKFIYKKSVPLVGQKTWKSGDRYDKAGVPIVTLFAAIDLEKNSKGFDYFANRLRKVAVDYVGKLIFNVGDKEDFSYQLEDYGLELSEKKDVGVGCKDGNKHYKMTDKFNVDNLKAFAEARSGRVLLFGIKRKRERTPHGFLFTFWQAGGCVLSLSLSLSPAARLCAASRDVYYARADAFLCSLGCA